AIAKANEDEKELEGYLLALRAKKRDMEEALNDSLASRTAQERVSIGGPSADAGARRVEQAESAFARVLTRQTGMAATTADSAAEAGNLQELAELGRTHRIAERLAAFKARLGS